MNKLITTIVVAIIAIMCIMSAGCVNQPVEEVKLEKFVIDYRIVDTVNSTGDITPIKKVYNFSYKDKVWNIVAEVPNYRMDNYGQEKYIIFKEKKQDYEPRDQRIFLEDEYVMDVVEQFKTQNGYLTDEELIEVLTYFVQTQIEYVTNEEQFGMFFTTYPMQILIDGRGSCSGKSSLLTSLFMHAGYDSIYIEIPTINHAIAAIGNTNVDVKPNAEFVVYNDIKYYLIETTGEIPIGRTAYLNYMYDCYLVFSKGYDVMYEQGTMVSKHDYMNNIYGFVNYKTGQWDSEIINE